MKIAVLGTGMVGRSLAAGLSRLDHQVAVGTRDPEATLARTEPDQMGNPPYADWQSEHTEVDLSSFVEAAGGADMVVNALSGRATLEVLSAIAGALRPGTVVLDIANPLDHSHGMPPTLFVKDTDSLGEQIQRAHPSLRVVKALNTMNASLMADPAQLADADFTTFVSGDDSQAKATVTALLRELGHLDVLDLGDITTARGSEMLLPIWLRLWSALGTPMFNFKIVR